MEWDSFRLVSLHDKAELLQFFRSFLVRKQVNSGWVARNVLYEGGSGMMINREGIDEFAA